MSYLWMKDDSPVDSILAALLSAVVVLILLGLLLPPIGYEDRVTEGTVKRH